MTKHPYTVFNLFCLFLVAITFGGVFLLWRDTLAPSITQDTTLPAAVSFQDIKNLLPPTVATSSVAQTPPSELPHQKNSSTLPVLPPSQKEIPKEINLAVPFTSQAPEKDWSEPWQDACEEASVLMLDAYYKNYTLSVLFSKDELLKMVNWEENTKGWGRSIEIEKVQQLIQFYMKKSSRLVENPTVDDIKQLVAAGTPVFVVADGKILPNSHFQDGGPEYHALIIRGYTSDSFITNDPGTQFGQNYKYKYADLMNSIRDWNGGDVKHGRRVVLVLQ